MPLGETLMTSPSASLLAMDRVLPLLRWKQTRRGYDGDDALLATAVALLQPDGRALDAAAQELNVPAARVVTEVLQLALLLVAKPRHNDRAHARAVLHVLHLSLKALRRCTGRATTSIPLNACNLLLTSMAETLESCSCSSDSDRHEEEEEQQQQRRRAIEDVHQVFVFLFGVEQEDGGAAPSFAMYKPPTNVYTAFLQRSAAAIVALLDRDSQSDDNLVALLRAVVVVFQELQHSQLNKKKVFLAIAKTSLRDLVTLRHHLSRHAAAGVAGVSGVRDVLDRVLVDALFDSEHLRAYEGAMTRLTQWQTAAADDDDEQQTQAPSNKRSKKQRRQNSQQQQHSERDSASTSASSLVSYQRHLFDELYALLADDALARDVRASIGSLLRVLVQGFAQRIRAAAHDKIEDSKAELKTSKKRVASVIATTSTTYSPFKFWAELCAVALDATAASDDVELSSDVAAALFAALGDADVYRVTEDTEDQEQFHMMERVLARTLTQCSSARSAAAVASVCAVVSSAVRCTPNLVHSARRTVLALLAELSHAGVDATSAAMVELLRAYESMRLVDACLRSCLECSDDSDAVASGLATVLRHHATEDALRRTFRTLPPGQLEIVWRLFRDRLAVLCGRGARAAQPLALVRTLLAVFLQELHITPQNRSKIGELVSETHEQLLVTLVSRVQRLEDGSHSQKKSKKKTNELLVTVVERELFSVFGELLALYDGLAPATRTATLDVVLAALEPKLVAVLSLLLADDTTNASAGVIKIGVHWLRKQRDADGLAALLLAHVTSWTSWDAVAFYLPDLLAQAPTDHAHALYRQVLSSLVAGGARGDAARRLLFDAAFFEIAALRRVAPAVIQELVKEATEIETLFEFLLSVPSGYLDGTDAAAMRSLVTTVLRVHRELSERLDDSNALALERMAQWIERYLAVLTEEEKELTQWTKALLLSTDATLPRRAELIAALVRRLVTKRNDALDAPLATLLARKTSPQATMQTSCLLLEAVANAPRDDAAPTPTFVARVLAWTRATPTLLATSDSDDGSAFRLLSALLRYSASLPESSAERKELLALLAPHLDGALALAMRRLTKNATVSERDASSTSLDAERVFFQTVCDVLPGLRAHVTLETFGCMLAAALCLAGQRLSFVESAHDSEHTATVDAPLLALVAHASKPEFRLLVATVQQELLAADERRVIAALKALVFTIESDKKLSPSRRQLLGEHKSALVGRLVELLGRALQTPLQRSLCGWTLRAFVLCYCKAELFSWQPHELLQVFYGFQPLTAAAHDTSDREDAWAREELHELWLLSYHLLLRVVRHHFASLLHALPLMVDALNSLLRVLTTQAARTSPPPRHVLEWSANLARLYGYLKPHDAAVRKHVVYLLVAYLRGVTHGALPLAVQQRLRAGVFALLEICSTFEKEQLYASLDAAGKSLLKSLDTSYKLTYRYAGKV